MPFSRDFDEMKKFYRDKLGLRVSIDNPFFVQFDGGAGSSLALLAVQPDQMREVELCFESADIEADAATLRGRGVEFMEGIKRLEFGSVIHFRDPEGSLLSLLQPARVGATASWQPAAEPALVGAGAAGGTTAAWSPGGEVGR